jgi:hypothetical protein
LNPEHYQEVPRLNKLGKIPNKTSWDSFSYALMMGHNVECHIKAVQRAQQLMDIECARFTPDWRMKSIEGKKEIEFSDWVPNKILYFGTFVEELDIFLTTSLVINYKLEELPKYIKLPRTIRNIEKNIENLAYSIDMINLIGNTSVIKLKRKTMIKDIIDLILIHTEWLKNQPKDRIDQMNVKYGVNKELTNLFFFELKDFVLFSLKWNIT